MALPIENGVVDVVHCKGTDLLLFEAFIERQEQKRTRWDDGIFKVIIDPLIEQQTAITIILDIVLQNLKHVQVQHVMMYAPENIYEYAATPNLAKPQVTRNFKEACSKLTSFNEETCCSQKLESDKAENLLNHFMHDIIERNAKNSEKKNVSWSANEKKNNLLIQGAELRKLYEETVKRGLPCNSVKYPCNECSCSDCVLLPSQRCTAEQTDAILYGAGVVLQNNKPISIAEGFSLSTIPNILDLTEHHHPGLSCPYFYLGSKHSFFPLHVEDALLWSINYLHFGLPKIWVVIPPRAVLLLNYHLWKSGLSLSNTSCWNILGHKTVLPSNQWLEERSIPYKIFVQRQGEAIVLYPNAPHFGFNTGWNVAEAINFATKSWIPDGLNAPRCQCLPGQVHLDMSPFVAAFRPDLLDGFLKREFIETERSLSMYTFFHKSIMVFLKTNGQAATNCKYGSMIHMNSANCSSKNHTNNNSSRRALCCPAPFCLKEYPHTKQGSLFSHVMKEHKPIVEKCKLLENIYDQLKKLKND